MKKVAFVAVALQISILSLFAASTPNECTLCVGAVAILQNAPPSPLPLLLQIREDDFATVGASLDPLTPEQRKKVAVLVEYTVTNDSLDEIKVRCTHNEFVKCRRILRCNYVLQERRAVPYSS